MNKNAMYASILLSLLVRQNKENHKGITLVDSTPLPVCANHRIKIHQVAKDIATHSAYSLGYFYGLKLHLATDTKDIILSIKITTGNFSDRDFLKDLLVKMKGIFVADAGYISNDKY